MTKSCVRKGSHAKAFITALFMIKEEFCISTCIVFIPGPRKEIDTLK